MRGAQTKKLPYIQFSIAETLSKRAEYGKEIEEKFFFGNIILYFILDVKARDAGVVFVSRFLVKTIDSSTGYSLGK